MKGVIALVFVLVSAFTVNAQSVISFVSLLPEAQKEDLDMKVLPLDTFPKIVNPSMFVALEVKQNQNDFNAMEKEVIQSQAPKKTYYTYSRPRISRRFASCGSGSTACGPANTVTYSNGNTVTYYSSNKGGYGLSGRRDRPVRFRNILPRNW